MKTILILTLTFFIAATSSIFGQSDKESQDILKGVSSKYKSYSTMKVDFLYTMEDPQNKTKETLEGNVSLKGDKYVLKIKGQEIMCDGKTVWTFLKDVNEVQVGEPDKGTDAVTPSTIFTMYEKGFDFKFIEEKTESGKAIQVIDIKPQDPKKNFFKVRLTINKAEKLITSSTVFNKNGSKLTYSIKQFTPNAAMSDAMFSFDKTKYPGVEVIDLR